MNEVDTPQGTDVIDTPLTGIPFQNFDEVKEWLLRWKELILDSLINK